jgi:hypothetical protein
LIKKERPELSENYIRKRISDLKYKKLKSIDELLLKEEEHYIIERNRYKFTTKGKNRLINYFSNTQRGNPNKSEKSLKSLKKSTQK